MNKETCDMIWFFEFMSKSMQKRIKAKIKIHKKIFHELQFKI
jgi:hypothetical protein